MALFEMSKHNLDKAVRLNTTIMKASLHLLVVLVAASMTLLTAKVSAEHASETVANVMRRLDFSHIDSYALAAPDSVVTSIPSLAKYLGMGATSDVEKARAIFRWITENIDYDVRGMREPRHRGYGAAEILSAGSTVCSGYSSLFCALGRELGLKSVEISGIGKGYGDGLRFSFGSHSWNAVMLDGEWHLLDCTWGAGRICATGNYVKNFEPYYFLSPPDQFVYSHLPGEPFWQLIENPVTRTEFENLVYLRPSFFTLGLGLDSHSQCKIVSDSMLSLSIIASDSVYLMTKILSVTGVQKELEGNYLFVQREKDRFRVLVSFPDSGIYRLSLLAKTGDAEGMYTGVADYLVEVHNVAEECFRFPLQDASFQHYNAYLYSPMHRYLRAEEFILFKIAAPGADRVKIICNDYSVELSRYGDIFEGQVFVLKGDVKVCAFEKSKLTYYVLLRYQAR